MILGPALEQDEGRRGARKLVSIVSEMCECVTRDRWRIPNCLLLTRRVIVPTISATI